MTVVLAQPPVVSEMYAAVTPLFGGCCFNISACRPWKRSWSRVAAVASASGTGVLLCPSALDGDAAPFGAASSLASAPPCRFRARFARPAVAIESAYRSMSSSLLVHMWCRVRVLTTWGPFLVPCSFCSPACVILSFFLGIFRGGSSGVSSSHCWSLLNWRHLSVFCPASAGGRSPLWPSGWRLRSSTAADRSRPGMGGRLSSPPSGEAGCGNSCTLD